AVAACTDSPFAKPAAAVGGGPAGLAILWSPRLRFWPAATRRQPCSTEPTAATSSISAFLESAGFPRTLAAGDSPPTPLRGRTASRPSTSPSTTSSSTHTSKVEMSNENSLLEYTEIVMKMFNSEDEGFEFYNDYAYEKGFSVRKDYCKWDSDHNERTLIRSRVIWLLINLFD
ncbi:unnamed protein product, partial [Urochloa humidicola]